MESALRRQSTGLATVTREIEVWAGSWTQESSRNLTRSRERISEVAARARWYGAEAPLSGAWKNGATVKVKLI